MALVEHCMGTLIGYYDTLARRTAGIQKQNVSDLQILLIQKENQNVGRNTNLTLEGVAPPLEPYPPSDV